MKIYALYLPAFHQIPENDEWWGEGFTEWDNVKRGQPLFKGHIQPQIPKNRNYYDLSKVETLREQYELAKQYCVDGFIFYHYWFDGKLLLEKPAENLLENKDIGLNYAFCWANEPWARTWDGKNTDILMPQKYGSKEDWIEHIKYFEKFFNDSRYIKIDNHPLLFVYSPMQIPNFDEMIDCWNEYLKNNGSEEIYLVEYICTRNPNAYSNKSNAVMEFEPMYTNRYQISLINKAKRLLCKKMKRIDFANYDRTWEKIINNKRLYGNRRIFKGCFCAWDNSPRKGKASTIFKGASAEKFENYLDKLINNGRKNAEENIIVINAWNEWGEGAMLEPTEKDQYSYLESIKKVVEKNGKK